MDRDQYWDCQSSGVDDRRQSPEWRSDCRNPGAGQRPSRILSFHQPGRQLDSQGGSWTAIPTAFPFSSASAYTGPAFAPNGNIIFGGFFASAASCGTWVSSNGGQTTTTATCNPQIGGLFSVMYNSVTQDLWLGSEQYGAFRSTDNGLSWTEVSPPDQTISPGNGIKDGNVYGLAFDSAGDVLMGTQGGIWKSRKSGNGYTWTNINSTADIKALGRDGSGNLYMGHHQDPLNPTTVYRSGDGGATWQKADSGIPQGLEAKQFIVNPNDRKMYTTVVDEASGRGWIYRTTVAVQ